MADYKLTKDFHGNETDEVVVRILDMASIPNDIKNRDWIQYLKWLEENNQPDPA